MKSWGRREVWRKGWGWGKEKIRAREKRILGLRRREGWDKEKVWVQWNREGQGWGEEKAKLRRMIMVEKKRRLGLRRRVG